MKQSQEHISKLISYWLRHNPHEANLKIDELGWAELNKVIEALKERGVFFEIEDLIALNNSFDKTRWEIITEHNKIRATHGHSISVILDDRAKTPPEILYHGTALTSVLKIMENGLLPMDRQFVHLSDNAKDAAIIGKRHGKPFVIEIFTEELIGDGWEFYQTSDNVWLTKQIPVKYLNFTPWHKTTDTKNNGVLNQLKIEIGNRTSHILYPHLDDLELIWTSQTCDDTLFRDNKTGKHYMIHLTFHKSQQPDGFPGFNSYNSFEEFVHDNFWWDNLYFFGDEDL
jgi:putative RNA 2'-phosphotransferase